MRTQVSLLLLMLLSFSTGCMNNLHRRVSALDGKLLYQNQEVFGIDLSRGEYKPMLDDPEGGSVGPKDPYVFDFQKPAEIDDQQFATIPLDSSIRKINLTGCHIGTATIQRIVQTCPNLTSLDLTDTHVTAQDMELVKTLGKLQELILTGTQIDDRCTDSLLELQSLETLNLVDTKIHSPSVVRLLSLPRLQQIYLFHTPAASEESAESEALIKDPRVITKSPYTRFII